MDYKVGDKVGVCPNCGGELVVRTGRYGKFIGCSDFPKCRKTYNIKTFRPNEEAVKLKNATTFEELIALTNSDDSTIRSRAETKLIQSNFCHCGEKVSQVGAYRLDPSYPVYLKQYVCPKCGRYVTRETRDYAVFVRMGVLEHNPHDEAIMGGYWI